MSIVQWNLRLVVFGVEFMLCVASLCSFLADLPIQPLLMDPPCTQLEKNRICRTGSFPLLQLFYVTLLSDNEVA